MSPANLTEASAALDESELDMEDSSPSPGARRPPAPVVLTPSSSPPQDQVNTHHRTQVLDHLLGMARQYAHNGSLRQAIELFFEVLSDHDGTPQACEAEEHLLAIAQHYEDQGELRLARGLYERLLKVS